MYSLQNSGKRYAVLLISPRFTGLKSRSLHHCNKRKIVVSEKFLVTTRLRYDEFVQMIPYGRIFASKPDVSSNANWLFSIIYKIKMCPDGVLNSLTETCAPER